MQAILRVIAIPKDQADTVREAISRTRQEWIESSEAEWVSPGDIEEYTAERVEHWAIFAAHESGTDYGSYTLIDGGETIDLVLAYCLDTKSTLPEMREIGLSFTYKTNAAGHLERASMREGIQAALANLTDEAIEQYPLVRST